MNHGIRTNRLQYAHQDSGGWYWCFWSGIPAVKALRFLKILKIAESAVLGRNEPWNTGQSSPVCSSGFWWMVPVLLERNSCGQSLAIPLFGSKSCKSPSRQFKGGMNNGIRTNRLQYAHQASGGWYWCFWSGIPAVKALRFRCLTPS